MKLTFDEAEAIGLDGTGMDGDPRFEHTYAKLTDEEKVRYWQYRIMTQTKLWNHGEVMVFVLALRAVAEAFGNLERAWMDLELPGDFVVPELGLPITMAVEETSAEVWVLAEHIEAAADEVFGYVGTHRG